MAIEETEESDKKSSNLGVYSGLAEMIAVFASLIGAVLSFTNFFDWSVVREFLQKKGIWIQIVATIFVVIGTLIGVSSSLSYKRKKLKRRKKPRKKRKKVK